MQDFEDQYEMRFSFVNEATLRSNLGDALKQVAELTALSEAYPTVVKAGLLKMSIVLTASIVEAVLHYYVKRKITHPVWKKEWKYTQVKLFETISQNPRKEIVTAYREKEVLDLGGTIQFNDIIEILHDEGFWTDEDLEEKVHDLRKKRNAIHLMPLGSVDRAYTKEMAEDIFKTARDVLLLVEAGLIP